MPKVWYGGGSLPGGIGEPIADITNQWMPIGCSANIGATDTSHITALLIINRVGGTIERIYVKVNANTVPGSASYQLQLRDHNGGSPTFQATTIVIVGGTTGYFSDLTTVLTLTAGQEYEWEWTYAGTGSGIMNVSTLSYALTPSSGSAFQWNIDEKTNINAASSTRYITPFGSNIPTTEINSMRAKMRVAGNLTQFGVRAFTNARTTDTVFQLQKAGVDIGSGVTFGSGVTGYIEDAGLGTPVAVAVDDYLSIRATTLTGTQILELTCAATTIVPTVDEFQCGVSSNGTVVSAGTTRYFPIMGEGVNAVTVDGNAKMKAPFTMGLDRFRGYIRANSLTGGETATLNIRVNGTIERSIVWTAPATGESSPSDSSELVVSVDDELDYSFVCTGGSGSAQLMNVVFRAVDLEVPVEPGAIVFNLQLG